MRTMSKLSFIALIISMILGCSSNGTSESGPEDFKSIVKPNWVQEYPVDPNYYIGISSASKTQYGAEALKSAQDLALADLASQITVTITSDIVTSLIEQGSISKEEYLATARSQAKADLEGHELVDTWQDPTYHFAYYRLSKVKYAEIQARKRRAALNLAVDFFKRGKASAQSGDFSGALDATIQSFLPLIPYLNEALEIELEGQTVILSNEINQYLHTLLTDIELVTTPSNIKGKLGKPVKQSLSVRATNGEKAAIQNLPLRLNFTKGAGELPSSITTVGSGVASFKISSLTSGENLQIVNISVDAGKIFNDSTSPVLSGIIKSIPIASAQITLHVEKPTIFLASTEQYEGQRLSQAQIEPQLKKYLIQEGFHFVGQSSQADWQMELVATATPGTEFSGMYTVFADVSVNVVDRSSGREIYKNSLSRVKGIDLSYPNATNKAFSSASDKLKATILPQILENLK